jgi:hypothetical protein
MPAGALAGVVRTNFIELDFDPHGIDTAVAAAVGRGGITRLEFRSAADGAVVPVSGLSIPATFTLPAPAAPAMAAGLLGVDGESASVVVFDGPTQSTTTHSLAPIDAHLGVGRGGKGVGTEHPFLVIV